MTATLKLARQLIAIESITPNDNGCQQIIAQRLQTIGFSVEHMRFGEVDNLWARIGNQAPLFVFAGHTDVVPTGPAEQWQSPPFEPAITDNILSGRGSADMKSSIAAMICACETLLENKIPLAGSIGFLITSDEEGPAVDGTVKVIEALQQRNEKIDMCLVGEPSSTKRLGDIIKNGRRGSLSATLTIHGKQGHIAYPQLADNPIHQSAAALAELCNEKWDEGNEFFPPTSFQISNIHAGTGTNNVIPGELQLLFNLRFSTKITPGQIQQRVRAILDKHQLKYDLDWALSGLPFITEAGELVEATKKAIHTVCGVNTELSTAGGTSDGRFIAPTGAQVIELGPINASIHQIDENINIDELEQLNKIYLQILTILLT